MEKIYIKEIIAATNGKILAGNEDDFICAVSTNSKQIEEYSLFVPLKGEKFDAHNFICEAFKNGAKAVLTELDEISYQGKIFIKVENTLKALQRLASFCRSKFNIPVIGITGSVGKTSTKEMVSAALSANFNVWKTKGNLNNEIGAPLTIFGIESCHSAAVIEMGISEFGEMKILSEIIKPNFGIISNIGVTHIENLKTRENILKEKFHITDTLGKNSTLFINADNDLLKLLKPEYQYDIITFGIEEDCNYKAENIEYRGNYSYFDVIFDDQRERIEIPAVGIHNVYNSLAAIAVGIRLGLSLEEIKLGLGTYQNAAMRQQVYHFEDITLIDDSYNANPDSMKSTVHVLNSINSEQGRRIAVLGDMLELGEISKQAHYDTGKEVAKIGLDILITVGEESRHIAQGAIDEDKKIQVYSFSSKDDAFECLFKLMQKGDKITIKGSRGLHLDVIVNKILDIKRR